MKSLEYLIQLHPDKTGKELLEIQEQEKLEDQKEFEEHNKKKLAFIKDLNENGGYYRGKFGLDQHYYYKVSNLTINKDGEVRMDVESVVLFCNNTDDTRHVTKPNEIHLDRKFNTYELLDRYGLTNCERVTVKEWNKINSYLDAMEDLFWKTK